MFYYPKSIKIGYNQADPNQRRMDGVPMDPNQRRMNGMPMGPDYRDMDGVPMNPNQRRMNGMPMRPDYRDMDGVPMDPNQRRMNGMPMGPDYRDMDGVPMDPNQRRMNGMPMRPDYRDMDGVPMDPNQRRMNGMPMRPDYRDMDGIPMDPNQRRMNGMPMGPDYRNMNDMPTDNIEQINQGNLRDALQMIRDNVQNERTDELFYNDLIDLAPDQEQRDMITSIRDDDRKNYRYYKDVYRDMTGETLDTEVESMQYTTPGSYLDGIRSGLFRKFDTIERNRRIYNALPTQYHRDILFEIMTDDLKHGSQFNYLYTTNI